MLTRADGSIFQSIHNPCFLASVLFFTISSSKFNLNTVNAAIPPAKSPYATPLECVGCKPYDLFWSDEFSELNLDWWDVVVSCPTGEENSACSTNDTKNIVVRDGLLNIYARFEKFDSPLNKNGSKYTTGHIVSADRLVMRYGMFEFRAKMPKGKNLRAVVSMVPWRETLGCEAASGKIVLLDMNCSDPGRLMSSAVVGRCPEFRKIIGPGWYVSGMDLTESFLTYSFEWTESSLAFSVNNETYFSINMTKPFTSDDGEDIYWGVPGLPFNTPFKLSFEVSVKSVKSSLSAEPPFHDWEKPDMQIDWVRVYQRRVPDFGPLPPGTLTRKTTKKRPTKNKTSKLPSELSTKKSLPTKLPTKEIPTTTPNSSSCLVQPHLLMITMLLLQGLASVVLPILYLTCEARLNQLIISSGIKHM